MSVYQIKGHWHYRFTINGVRYRKAIKEAQTKRQAERAEQIARNEVFERRWGETGQRNFAEFVDKTYKPHAKAHKAGYLVENSVLSALVRSFGNLRLAEITPEKVERFQLQRASETTTRNKLRSKATVNRDLAVLSAIFKLALRLGEVKENPVSKIKWYGNLPKRDRVLSTQEEFILLNGLQHDTNLAFKVEILLYTGMRRGELFKLEWRDVDFQHDLIRLRPEMTKTGKSRLIPMLSNVKMIFTRLANIAPPTMLPTSLVFPGLVNRSAAFSQDLTEACKRLNIEHVTAHTLRHTFSTWANEFGVDVFAQKQALGHSKLSQTADYTHQSNETFQRNFEGFDVHLRKRNQNTKND